MTMSNPNPMQPPPEVRSMAAEERYAELRSEADRHRKDGPTRRTFGQALRALFRRS